MTVRHMNEGRIRAGWLNFNVDTGSFMDGEIVLKFIIAAVYLSWSVMYLKTNKIK